MWCAVLSEKEILMRRQAYLDRGLTVDGRGKVNSLQLKVNSNGKNNENNRLSGNDGNPAVSAGSAVQPAQPGDSMVLMLLISGILEAIRMLADWEPGRRI